MHPKSVALLLFLLTLLPGSASYSQSEPQNKVKIKTVVPKGGRSFGLDVNPPQDGDYGKAFLRMRSIGGSVQTLSLNWTDIEAVPNKLSNPNLAIANAFYPAQKTRLLLVLRPLNTNRRETPSDLADKPFDDSVVVARFKKVIDYVFEQTPQVDFTAIAIGNEVDNYLQSDTTQIAHYRAFYEQIREYIRSKKPTLRVGVVVTMDGLRGANQEKYFALNTKSDVILTTYYPLNPDFTVKPPEAPLTDMVALTQQYSGRTIIFTEAGYPSSALCKSSEEKQAAFVRSVFSVWDKVSKQVETIVFSWMSDLSSDSVKIFQGYYGSTNTAFGEYMRTLGFRTQEGLGTDKPAFNALKEEAKRRGWQ